MGAHRVVQVATTNSGAVYAHCGAVLLRFNGWDISSYNLESGLPNWEVGDKVKALVLPADGKGVMRVSSTRITGVHRKTAGNLNGLPAQIAQIARVAAALDLVGKVDMPAFVPPGPLQKALLDARRG